MVAAPGEAEATCAALDAAGLVDGCATADADALLFGARCVFCTLRLTARPVLATRWGKPAWSRMCDARQQHA